MKIWITRDKGCQHGANRVYFWKTTKAPKKVSEDGVVSYQNEDAISDEKVAEMLVDEFNLVFGFKPALGSCKRYFIPVIKEAK